SRNLLFSLHDALPISLELSPQNLAVQKVGVWILLGKHEFAQARQQAEILNRRMPDDVQVYGFLTDANIELGNYADAEKAAQWMRSEEHTSELQSRFDL